MVERAPPKQRRARRPEGEELLQSHPYFQPVPSGMARPSIEVWAYRRALTTRIARDFLPSHIYLSVDACVSGLTVRSLPEPIEYRSRGNDG